MEIGEMVLEADTHAGRAEEMVERGFIPGAGRVQREILSALILRSAAAICSRLDNLIDLLEDQRPLEGSR